jgi:hypothetical protein
LPLDRRYRDDESQEDEPTRDSTVHCTCKHTILRP